MKDEMAGTTAIVVILKNNKIYCVRISFCVHTVVIIDYAIHSVILYKFDTDTAIINLKCDCHFFLFVLLCQFYN